MASKENEVWKRFLLKASQLGARFWRNNVGSAWAGPGFTMKRGQVYTAHGGERLIMRPQPIEFGLCEGSGDGIGFVKVEITPSMVGMVLPIFASAETKSAKGTMRKKQIEWNDFVLSSNGISVVVRDPEALEFKLPMRN